MTARAWFLWGVPAALVGLTVAIVLHALAQRSAAETVRAGMAEMADACR
jgi:cytochrome c-type biogenesis protein CcmH/NrfF